MQGRFPVPFDSMLASRDAVANGDENAAFEYFKDTFVCTGECRVELREHGVFMEDIDVKQEKQRLEGTLQSNSAETDVRAASGRRNKLQKKKTARKRQVVTQYEL